MFWTGRVKAQPSFQRRMCGCSNLILVYLTELEQFYKEERVKLHSKTPHRLSSVIQAKDLKEENLYTHLFYIIDFKNKFVLYIFVY